MRTAIRPSHHGDARRLLRHRPRNPDRRDRSASARTAVPANQRRRAAVGMPRAGSSPSRPGSSPSSSARPASPLLAAPRFDPVCHRVGRSPARGRPGTRGHPTGAPRRPGHTAAPPGVAIWRAPEIATAAGRSSLADRIVDQSSAASMSADGAHCGDVAGGTRTGLSVTSTTMCTQVTLGRGGVGSTGYPQRSVTFGSGPAAHWSLGSVAHSAAQWSKSVPR